MAIPINDRLTYSVTEAAELLGISRARIFQLIKDGTIESVKLGGRRLVPRSGLEQLLAERPGDDPRAQVVEAAAELVARTTKDQGLPRTVSDAGALQRIAAILRATPSLHAAGGDAA